jgi:hypothetical protein
MRRAAAADLDTEDVRTNILVWIVRSSGGSKTALIR